MATDNDDTNTETPQETPKALRDAAERGRKAEQEAAELRKELMFARAGIDTEKKVGRMLFQTWEGDDIEALKAEASELGLLAPVAPPPAEPENVREQQQFRRDLGAGAPPAAHVAETPDPTTEALHQFQKDVESGVPRDRAQLAAFDRVFTAAVAGDQRAIFDPTAWAEMARQS